MQVRSLAWEDPLEEGRATHSRILAWRIPGTEKPGRLQSIGSHRVGHDSSDLARLHSLICRRPTAWEAYGLWTFCFHFKPETQDRWIRLGVPTPGVQLLQGLLTACPDFPGTAPIQAKTSALQGMLFLHLHPLPFLESGWATSSLSSHETWTEYSKLYWL